MLHGGSQAVRLPQAFRFEGTEVPVRREGDAVILPTPWYFNPKMWLDMAGVQTVPLPTGESLIPDAAAKKTG